MRNALWRNKKKGLKNHYRGTYRFTGSGQRRERIFVLVPLDDRRQEVVCESHEAAKKLGWEKV